MKTKNCPYCSEEIKGRSDKKYCSPYCKSAYFYEQTKRNVPSFFKTVDLHLRTNRRLLKEYNKAGKATIRKEVLLNAGFNPKYFTHYWKNKKGDVYLFCYEFGFLEVTEKDSKKFVLVKWQEYMD